MPTPIITDGSMDRLVRAPKVVLPKDQGLFAERASRFDQLAAESSGMGDYMRLLAQVCRAQSAAFKARTAHSVSERAIANSREHGMPPLSAHVFPRDESWHIDLRDIVAAVQRDAGAMTPEVTATLKELGTLAETDHESLDAIADRLIAGDSLVEDSSSIPFVGAALQVYFTRLASTLKADSVSNCDVASVCPCCGMRPTASLVRIDPDRLNYRYLVCSLCMTEWNMERVRCSSCESEKDVAYMAIESNDKPGLGQAVSAETCDSCKTYLKIFSQEKDALVDPIADDLNSLALDLLVDEKGYARTGPNLLFYPGHV